jgi:DNA-binding response OmpR family regulator
MSGWDVFNHIKKKNRDIKIAFMSVLEISDKRKQVLLEEGLADYIMKPFDKDSLLERVDNILKE